ncbi:MAG: hypothetical protein JWR80_8909 [Bradyrhizobium sp.]|nr:hypothetical protein [Bradyrhizobium sp.]
MSGPGIEIARLSFVAGQCFFEHRARVPAPAEPVLWRRAYYSRAYNLIQGGQAQPRFAQAWRRGQQSSFWSHYLGGRALSGVDADSAWRALVPMRLIDPAAPALATDDPRERVIVDCYGYPNGLTAAVTIQSPARVTMDLGHWPDRARQLRRTSVFTLSEQAKGPPTPPGIDAAIAALLDWYRNAYYGPVAEIFGSSDTISVGAVIKASGIDPAAPIDADLHRLLYAVTAWPVDWQQAVLPDLTSPDVLLPVGARNVAAGDAFYAARRGRTLWRPSLFGYVPAPGEPPTHTLSCLAHNVLAGTVQAETLRVFALGLAGSPSAAGILDDEELNRAATLIDAMLRGVQTYRSSSLRALLQDSGSRAEVNALLASQKLATIA